MKENMPRYGEDFSGTVPAYVLPAGTVLNGRYRLEQLLGKGGFGITYKARDMTLDVPVAVKEYFPDQVVTRNAELSGAVTVTAGEKKNLDLDCENFLEEARRLGQFVDEPGIVGVRDFFRENGTAYIVMEYLSGETLRSFLDRQGKISMPEALELLEPVMRSLDKVHKAGLIHRDISPENIFLTGQGAKLLDFGTARPAAAREENRHTVLVKPGYAPAEQYDEESSQGPWCDVYSLCAVLYECVTGKAPQDSLRRLFKDSLLPPSQCGISVPAGQEKALMKGLALKKEDRYQTVSELAGALGLPAFGPAAKPPRRSGRTVPASAEDRELLRQLKARQQQPERPPRPEAGEGERPARKTEAEKGPGPDPSPARQRKARRRAGKGKHSGKKLLFLAVGALAALIAVFAVFASLNTVTVNGVTYAKDEHDVIKFENTVVRVRELRKVKAFPNQRELVFRNCTFEDGSFEAIGALENVYALSFYQKFPAVDADCPFVTGLSLSSVEALDSLDFLRHFPALTQFSLGISYASSSKITDFSPISSLTELRHLSLESTLSRNGVTDLSFLSGLKDLVSLYANADPETPESARVTDLDPLAGCPKLEMLELDDNRIGDLGPLAGCAALRWLKMNNNRVADLSPLAGCPNLYHLELNGNMLTSLSGLQNARGIGSLDLDGNQLSDISALAGTADITWFSARNNQISDLTPLAGNGSMNYLNVGNNALSSLAGCEQMVKLKTLNASYNQLGDIEGIKNCSVLETVGLSYNQLQDISPLGNNGANLKYLEAAHNRIGSLDGLAGCTGLEAFSCAFNAISDLSPLKNATGLAALLLAGNQIDSLSPLSGMTQMAFLDARDNRLSSISGMENMTQLGYIDLSGNRIESISGFPAISQTYKMNRDPFQSLSGLTLRVSGFTVFLEHNQIRDLSPLPEAVEYRLLSVYDNPLEDYERFAGLHIDTSITGKGVYVPYREGNDTAPLTAFFAENKNCRMVDVPADRQGQWEKDIKGETWRAVEFLTAEAADAALAAAKPDSAAKAASQAEGQNE